ncbi:a-factor receptor [Orbilia oligospora]|uniref:A-factor receptor n=1 Tax=Orbilia oligospora TaxID=2813651 RepID=A0A8H8VB06_ORBOL|nr:a-factor receptor [Orbilia oligospora]
MPRLLVFTLPRLLDTICELLESHLFHISIIAFTIVIEVLIALRDSHKAKTSSSLIPNQFSEQLSFVITNFDKYLIINLDEKMSAEYGFFVFCSITAILGLVVPFIWQIRRENVAAALLCFWLQTDLLFCLTDAIIWPTWKSVITGWQGRGYCDFVIKWKLAAEFGAINAAVMCIMLTICRLFWVVAFYKINKHLAERTVIDIFRSDSSLDTSFQRLYLIGALFTLIYYPTNIYGFVQFCLSPMLPYDWDAVHADWWDTIYKFPDNPHFQYQRWIKVVASWILGIVFGFGPEAEKIYWDICCLFHIQREVQQCVWAYKHFKQKVKFIWIPKITPKWLADWQEKRKKSRESRQLQGGQLALGGHVSRLVKRGLIATWLRWCRDKMFGRKKRGSIRLENESDPGSQDKSTKVGDISTGEITDGISEKVLAQQYQHPFRVRIRNLVNCVGYPKISISWMRSPSKHRVASTDGGSSKDVPMERTQLKPYVVVPPDRPLGDVIKYAKDKRKAAEDEVLRKLREDPLGEKAEEEERLRKLREDPLGEKAEEEERLQREREDLSKEDDKPPEIPKKKKWWDW